MVKSFEMKVTKKFDQEVMVKSFEMLTTNTKVFQIDHRAIISIFTIPFFESWLNKKTLGDLFHSRSI